MAGECSMNLLKKIKLLKIVKFFLCFIFIFYILFPLTWIFLMSVKDFKDIIAYPPKFIFTPSSNNYKEILLNNKNLFELTKIPPYVKYLLNSIITTVGAVVLSLLVGLPAAYSLARSKIIGKENLSFTFLSFRFAPELMVILPLFTIFKTIKLYDTFLGLILVHQLITLPLVIWIMLGFFKDIPMSIEEAARIDGASVWTTFYKIILPMTQPGIGAALVISFIFSWNNLLFGLIMSGTNTMPITMGILQAMTFDQIKWGLMAAAAIFSAIPGIIIAVFFQKFLVRGLTLGAIK